MFDNIEQQIVRTLTLQPNNGNNNGDGNWQEVQGSWVLRPPPELGPPLAVVHFVGGAFVGAAPQLTYRLFLECLASRRALIIATPFETAFNHLRISDELQFKFDRCYKALGPEVADLPVFGVGHSLGSLMHLLISARYAAPRAGNALLSFNNRPATDSIPFLSPLIAPSARLLGPILQQVANSPLAPTADQLRNLLRGLSPALLKQVLPLVDQLTPIYLEVSQGKQEFTPTPDETRELIRSYYAVPRNLLIRFTSDDLDQTQVLSSTLASGAAVSNMLDMSIKTLAGDHIRPMQQVLGDLPPEVAQAATQAVSSSSSLLGRLSAMATEAGLGAASASIDEVAKGVSGVASSVLKGARGGATAEDMQDLADEVARWMGLAVPVKPYPALPSARF